MSEQRRGFSGQSLTVEVMSEGQLLGESVRDSSDYRGGGNLNIVLNRALKDPTFTHVRLIDEYGTTVFNSLQLIEVHPELEQLREFTESDEEVRMLEGVLEFAERVRSRVHHFLVFLGD